MIRLEIKYYLTEQGKSPYVDWFEDLDASVKGYVAARINRLALGNLGDCRVIGEGITELRLFRGPGYRVYFAMDGHSVVILLTAGSKGSQSRDIDKAKTYWKNYLEKMHGKDKNNKPR